MRVFSSLAILILLNASWMRPEAADNMTRRIIVNNAGEVSLPLDGDDADWDRYLGERLRHAVGTQVDSYFLNIGATDRGPRIIDSLQSSMAYWASGEEAPAVYDAATRRYIGTEREAGMEIFASIRMNDVHDRTATGLGALTYPLKQKRPDLLLGNADSMKRGRAVYPEDSVMSWFWCGLNWGKEDVREHFLEFIRWYCSRYDFDGLELDYYRHPLFFRIGEERQHAPAMTEFVGQVRNTLNQIGAERRELSGRQLGDTQKPAVEAGISLCR